LKDLFFHPDTINIGKSGPLFPMIFKGNISLCQHQILTRDKNRIHRNLRTLYGGFVLFAKNLIPTELNIAGIAGARR
jgi:hypothetical protein